MSKLLGKQELFDYLQEEYRELGDGAVKEIVSIIQSQKIAHADMVIGEFELTETITDPEIWFGTKSRNNLRAEQRERNK